MAKRHKHTLLETGTLRPVNGPCGCNHLCMQKTSLENNETELNTAKYKFSTRVGKAKKNL